MSERDFSIGELGRLLPNFTNTLVVVEYKRKI